MERVASPLPLLRVMVMVEVWELPALVQEA